MIDPSKIDPTDPFVVAMAAVGTVFVCALVLSIAEGLRLAVERIAAWRTKRRLAQRLRRLPAPDDPRLRNSTLLRDWKHRNEAIRRLNTASRQRAA